MNRNNIAGGHLIKPGSVMGSDLIVRYNGTAEGQILQFPNGAMEYRPYNNMNGGMMNNSDSLLTGAIHNGSGNSFGQTLDYPKKSSSVDSTGTGSIVSRRSSSSTVEKPTYKVSNLTMNDPEQYGDEIEISELLGLLEINNNFNTDVFITVFKVSDISIKTPLQKEVWMDLLDLNNTLLPYDLDNDIIAIVIGAINMIFKSRLSISEWDDITILKKRIKREPIDNELMSFWDKLKEDLADIHGKDTVSKKTYMKVLFVGSNALEDEIESIDTLQAIKIPEKAKLNEVEGNFIIVCNNKIFVKTNGEIRIKAIG